MNCQVSQQIAQHVDEPEPRDCPFCREYLEELSNVDGTWYKCVNPDCDKEYETEQR